MKTDARSIAARVVTRVERDGAFAAAALDAELARHPELDPRDRALATELSYGTLRCRAALLTRLSRFAPRGLGKTHPAAVAHMLVAAYQILLLDRVPAHAAVNAAVGAITREQGKRVAGFANAVLRKVASAPLELSRGQAVVESVPPWLWERLTAAVGDDEARALVGADPGRGVKVGVRVVGDAPLPAWLEEAEPGRASPRARLLTGGGDLRLREGFAEGRFVIQEEGAQVVGLALGARPGERVLDACAGRGQKTTLLAEQVGAAGEVWATDLYPEKLAALDSESARLGLSAVHTAGVDWTVGSGGVPEAFDRVLVDAPCTGVGTLERRPEIAHRLRAEDPARLAKLAEQILRRALRHAKPGGRVVFAVCSVLPEEGPALCKRVSDVLEAAPFDAPELAHLLTPGATSSFLLPHRHGTEGYFVASFRRPA